MKTLKLDEITHREKKFIYVYILLEIKRGSKKELQKPPVLRDHQSSKGGGDSEGDRERIANKVRGRPGACSIIEVKIFLNGLKKLRAII